jgi:hypothetical protein
MRVWWGGATDGGYLSIPWHRDLAVNAVYRRRMVVIRSAGLKAMCGLASQLQDREVSSIGLRVQRLDSVVMPVLEYGCEVWGT